MSKPTTTKKNKWIQLRVTESEKQGLFELCRMFDPEKAMAELFWIAIDLLKLKIANLDKEVGEMVGMDELYGPDHSYARLTVKDIDKLKSIEGKIDSLTELFRILSPDK